MRPVLALTLLLLSGCGSARRGIPVAPPAQLDARALQGEAVFAQHCHGCHPHGEGGLGLTLNNRPLPAFLVRFQVRNGLGAMPSISRAELPPDELDLVVEFMRQMRRSPGPVAPEALDGPRELRVADR